MVLDGAWPDDDDAVGVAVDEELAARVGVGVGDSYRLQAYTMDQFGPAGEGADIRPQGAAVDLVVRGIVRYPNDLQPGSLDQQGIYVDKSDMYLTPAFWDTHGPDLARYGIGVTARLTEELRSRTCRRRCSPRSPIAG